MNKANGCVEFTLYKDRDGYGNCTTKLSKSLGTNKAHRLSYIANIGPIPQGHLVCHRCDNPSCINPEHLFSGTSQDNLSDMVNKGRSTLGSKNPNSKLNEKQVIEIKAMKGRLTGKKVGEIYKINHSTVYDIWNNRKWKHL